jgi:hypothetical protein
VGIGAGGEERDSPGRIVVRGLECSLVVWASLASCVRPWVLSLALRERKYAHWADNPNSTGLRNHL